MSQIQLKEIEPSLDSTGFEEPAQEKPTKNLVIFFHNDADGWGAMGLALNALTEPNFVYKTKPVQYGEDFSNLVETLGPTDHVYVLDFSFPREICDAIYAKVEKFVVLDHHKTAMKALEGAPYAIFDVTKSGVLLAWEYFFPEMVNKSDCDAMPMPVRLLDNYDLWKKDDEVRWHWTVGFHLFVQDHLGDYVFWRELMSKVELEPATLNIMRQKYMDFEASVAEIMQSANFRTETVNGKTMVFYPCASNISLIADAVRDKFTCNFTASYFLAKQEEPIEKQSFVINLRGTPGFPVRALAEHFGGGGHDMAAGFHLKNVAEIQQTDEAQYMIDKIKEAVKLL